MGDGAGPSKRAKRGGGAGGAAGDGVAAAAPPGLATLPPSIQPLLAHAFYDLNPFYDRADMLGDAARLALVGNPICTTLARHMFSLLSPRLGECVG